MVASIVEELTITPRPVFVDEADYLLRDRGVMLDVLRDIYDLSKVPIVMIGMETFARDLAVFGQGRMKRRVSQWIQFTGLDEDDSALVMRGLSEVEIADDLCLHVHKVMQGNVGRISIAVSRIEAVAKANGMERITLADWGTRKLMLPLGPSTRRGGGRVKRSKKDRAARAMIAMKRSFTVAEIAEQSGLYTGTVRTALDELRERGSVERCDAVRMHAEVKSAHVVRWKIVGSPTLPLPAPTQRQRVWTAIRVHRDFTTRDVSSSIGVPLETVKSLVRELVRARVVVEAGRKQPHGQPGSFKCFRLGRDLGPDLPTGRELRAMAKAREEAGRQAAEVTS